MAKLNSMQEIDENDKQKKLFERYEALALSDKHRAETLFKSYEEFIKYLVFVENYIQGNFKNSLNDFSNLLVTDIKNKRVRLFDPTKTLTTELISAFFIANELTTFQQVLILKWFLINVKTYADYSRFINRSFDKAMEFYYKELINENTPKNDSFDFEKIKSELNDKDNKERKIYLIEIITSYKQQYNSLNDIYEANFLQKCEFELEKLKQLTELEQQHNLPESGPEKEENDIYHPIIPLNELTFLGKMKKNVWIPILFSAFIILFFLAWAKPGSKLDFFGWFKVEQGDDKSKETTNREPKAETVTIIGSLKINNKNAWSEDVKKVYVKGQTLGAENTPSNNKFVLRGVSLQKDRIIEIGLDLQGRDNLSHSAMFKLPPIDKDNVSDLGEVLIEVKPPTPKSSGSAKSSPTFIINNQNIQK
jgi:hypothetical protein